MQAAELLDAERSVVVVIDLQGKLMEMIHRRDLVIAGTKRLLQIAEIFARPVILTEQYPEGLGSTHPEIHAAFEALTTPKQYVRKVAFGCCGDPAFEATLAAALPGLPPARRQVVVAGIE